MDITQYNIQGGSNMTGTDFFYKQAALRSSCVTLVIKVF
jgi:hypothetical protein